MGALRDTLASGLEARKASLHQLRDDLSAHLGAASARRSSNEEERREGAAHDRGSRQMFINDLTSTVESLKAGVQTFCAEMKADRDAMAEELSAAARAFRGQSASRRPQAEDR
jgi:hypothetical protein